MATIFRDYEEERSNKVIPEGTVNIYVGKAVKTTSIIIKKTLYCRPQKDIYPFYWLMCLQTGTKNLHALGHGKHALLTLF